jgi:FkbM family methyltransferase
LLARLAGAGHASIIPAAGFPVARWTAALKQGGKRHGKRVMSMTSRPVDPPRVKQALRWLSPQSFLNWREKNYFHRHGEQEMHLVEFLCRRDQDAIDVGANYGGYVHFMRGHAKRVFAFEPIPEFARLLRLKFGRDVVVEQIALSNRSGISQLCAPIVDGLTVHGCATLSANALFTSTYAMHRDIEVRVDLLDNVYSGAVAFIKIDVEGHEQAVLDGAVQTIGRCLPRTLVEIEEHMTPGGLDRARTFFSRFDYRGYYVHAGRLESIDQFSVAEMQNPVNRGSLTSTLRERVTSNVFVNNFIFLPPNEPRTTLDRIGERLAGRA